MKRATLGIAVPDDEADACLAAQGPDFGCRTLRVYYALVVLTAPDGQLVPFPLGAFRYTLAQAAADADSFAGEYRDPAVGSLILIFDSEVPGALKEWEERSEAAQEEARQWQQ